MIHTKHKLSTWCGSTRVHAWAGVSRDQPRILTRKTAHKTPCHRTAHCPRTARLQSDSPITPPRLAGPWQCLGTPGTASFSPQHTRASSEARLLRPSPMPFSRWHTAQALRVPHCIGRLGKPAAEAYRAVRDASHPCMVLLGHTMRVIAA